MIVVVTGGRNFNDRGRVWAALDSVHSMYQITELVEGEASGVDRLCAEWAVVNGVKCRRCPADWKNLDAPGAVVKQGAYGPYNAAAGHSRNQAMLDTAPCPVYGIVFPGGAGTRDMHKRMLKTGIAVYVPYPDES